MSDIMKSEMKKIKLKGQKLDMVVDLVNETDDYYEVQHDLGILRIDKSKVQTAQEEKVVPAGTIALIANGSGQRIPYVKSQAGYWLVAASASTDDSSRNIGTRSVVDSFTGDNAEIITYKQFLDIVQGKMLKEKKDASTTSTESNGTETYSTLEFPGDGPGSSNETA